MIRVRQVKININNKDNLKKKIALKLKVSEKEILDYKIIKESIDARDKKNILLIYEVVVNLVNENNISFNNDISEYNEETFKFNITGNNVMTKPLVIVGSGPAGLFAAYMLSKNGFKVKVIERGEMIDERVKSVNNFWGNGNLNINSNIQFGEGGAGTFSDGKLNTLVKDPLHLGKEVFDIFVKHGAPDNIMYSYKPHIGTDILRNVIKSMRNEIIKNNGEFLFNTKMTDILIKDNKVIGIEVNNKDIIECDDLILAIGHSARDTYELLNKKKIEMRAKPFALGVRVIHNQRDIDTSMYGKSYDILGPATYKLTYQASNGRGVYSFCMCPGGYVVNASSEEGCLVVNGMSNNDRGSSTANSAIVVTVNPADFGNNPLDGVSFQKDLEKRAYSALNGLIPISLYNDYKNNRTSKKLGDVEPNICGKYDFYDLNKVLPDYINVAIKEGMEYFGKKIQGFNNDDVILAGIEARTSSPVKIPRDEYFMCNVKGIYPIGEGAGASGGITTSAIDGIKVALIIASIYKK